MEGIEGRGARSQARETEAHGTRLMHARPSRPSMPARPELSAQESRTGERIEFHAYSEFPAYPAYSPDADEGWGDWESQVGGDPGKLQQLFDEFFGYDEGADKPQGIFEDVRGFFAPVNSVPQTLVERRRSLRGKVAKLAAVLVIVMLGSLLVNPGQGILAPSEAWECYDLWFSQLFAAVVAPFDVLDEAEIVALQPNYYEAIERVGVTAASALCGAAAGVAGLLLQAVFRQRLAVVPVACASTAAGLGDAVLIGIFGAVAVPAYAPRLLIGVVLACAAVFAMKLIWRRRQSSMVKVPGRARETKTVARGVMLLPGRAIAAIAVVYLLGWGVWEALAGGLAGLGGAPDAMGWVVMLVAGAVGFVPVIALRFRLGGLMLAPDDARQLGIDVGCLRMVALACAAVLLALAQVQTGPMGVIAVAAPVLARLLFGTEFRSALVGSALIGAILLVV